MEGNWSTFIELFRDRIAKTNIVWDGRAVGAMAYQLTDRRRNERVVISLELAEEIAALHGAWKSYNSEKGTLNHWLTPDVQSEFRRRVEYVLSRMKS